MVTPVGAGYVGRIIKLIIPAKLTVTIRVVTARSVIGLTEIVLIH